MMGMPRYFALAAVVGFGAIALAGGCTKDVEYFCNAEKTCPDRYPDRPYCNLATQTCEANPVGGVDAGDNVDAAGGGADGGVVDAMPNPDAYSGQRIVVRVVGNGVVTSADGDIQCGNQFTQCEVASPTDLLNETLTATDTHPEAGKHTSFLGWSMTGPISEENKCSGFGRVCPVFEPDGWRGTVVVTATFGTPGEQKWIKSFGGSGDESLVAVAATQMGDQERVFIAGNFSGTLDLGGKVVSSDSGSLDYYVAMIDPADGAVMWAVRGGGVGHDTAFDVTATVTGHVTLIAGLDCTRATPQSADCTDATSVRLVKLDGGTGAELHTETYTGSGLSVTRALVAQERDPAYFDRSEFAFGLTFTGTIDLPEASFSANGGLSEALAVVLMHQGFPDSNDWIQADHVRITSATVPSDLRSLRFSGVADMAAGGSSGAVQLAGMTLANGGGSDAFLFRNNASVDNGYSFYNVPGDQYSLYVPPLSRAAVQRGFVAGASAVEEPSNQLVTTTPFVGVAPANSNEVFNPRNLVGHTQHARVESLRIDERGYSTVTGCSDSRIGPEGGSLVGRESTGTAWLASFDPTATPRYFFALESSVAAAATSCTVLTGHDVTLSGEIVAGGHFFGDLGHPSGTLLNKGNRDIVVVKVSP